MLLVLLLNTEILHLHLLTHKCALPYRPDILNQNGGQPRTNCNKQTQLILYPKYVLSKGKKALKNPN